MPHCTPEQLALAALREPLPADRATHLASCPSCTRELTALRRSVDALAVPQLAAPSGAVPPPPSVWDAIEARTGVTARPRPEVVASPLLPAPEPRPAAAASEVQLPRRRPSRAWLAVAAAALLGAGVG